MISSIGKFLIVSRSTVVHNTRLKIQTVLLSFIQSRKVALIEAIAIAAAVVTNGTCFSDNILAPCHKNFPEAIWKDTE